MNASPRHPLTLAIAAITAIAVGLAAAEVWFLLTLRQELAAAQARCTCCEARP